MLKTSKWAAVALPIMAFLIASGCGIQASHPNQLSAFDGAAYDSLLLAHGALASLEGNIQTGFPKYVPMFNQANTAYGAAYSTYATFRTEPKTQAEVAVAIGNLVVAVVAIENVFQSDMHVSPASVAHIRAQARRLRTSAKQAGISVSDLLTELEIAAAVARTIPAGSQYAALAQLVAQATEAALSAETVAAGQPIDLTQIQPMPMIQ